MEAPGTAAAAGRGASEGPDARARPLPPAARPLVVVTGGGSGISSIGRALVLHFASDPSVRRVVTCGRRAEALEATRAASPRRDVITVVRCDIASEEGRRKLLAAVPQDLPLRLLVHNAAIGDPAPLESLAVAHFEESLRVNVVAPLALTQALLPLLRGGGRVLHLGTSVAHTPQRATATYGVTKAAFFRLYQQLNAEGLGVPCGSLSPGLVDTEGVRDHVAKARALDLPHVAFFDRAFEAVGAARIEGGGDSGGDGASKKAAAFLAGRPGGCQEAFLEAIGSL
ncbi:unnamed protein product [Prorocentrum cordatum]|uniref:Sepiapterin reductase n=1 Tax=Prorocentrum cordatum TaxID=2364126 RepID=A0ABN9UJX8_9DINO|nr:unnamed protein product [Polarella glacialis]